MPGGIFVLHDDGTLIKMRETPYDSEALLQRLLAEYPDLLAGDQTASDEPRRWLLVSREMRVPGDEGADRGYLDHLFLDQDAVPTLVEVKRSNNTQIRREVVGQMLDYAANGVAFWSVEAIRSSFEKTCIERGIDSDQRLTEFVGADAGPEDFWQRVKTNLQAERIRLVFVADEIPSGLRRIVEFLNGQMNPAEVLAVEIRQHLGPGMKVLVPALIGQTSKAQRVKSAGANPGRKWDETSFFEDLEAKQPNAVPMARKILDWAKQRAIRIAWGTGTQSGSFVPIISHKGIDHQLFAVYSYGTFETFFQYYQNKLPFRDEAMRVEKMNRLNGVPGLSLPADGIKRRPSFLLTALPGEDSIKALTDVYEWVSDQIRSI